MKFTYSVVLNLKHLPTDRQKQIIKKCDVVLQITARQSQILNFRLQHQMLIGRMLTCDLNNIGLKRLLEYLAMENQ